MPVNVVSLAEKVEKLNVQNEYRIIAQMNNYQFKIIRMDREFIWHSHEDTDETFFVIDGELEIALRNRILKLQKNEMAVIPKGIDHKPKSIGECKIMLIEPGGTLNTSNAGGQLTDTREEWIWIKEKFSNHRLHSDPSNSACPVSRNVMSKKEIK